MFLTVVCLSAVVIMASELLVYVGVRQMSEGYVCFTDARLGV